MAFDSKGTLNKVMLIGRLGQDPELKYTTSGAAVLNASIATNTSWKGQDGSQNEETEWHRCIMWRKLAEIIEQYGKKGDRIYVEGRNVTRQWEDKDGNKRYSTEIQVSHASLLGSGGDSSKSPRTDEPQEERPQSSTQTNNNASQQQGNDGPPLPPEPDYSSTDDDSLPF